MEVKEVVEILKRMDHLPWMHPQYFADISIVLMSFARKEEEIPSHDDCAEST